VPECCHIAAVCCRGASTASNAHPVQQSQEARLVMLTRRDGVNLDPGSSMVPAHHILAVAGTTTTLARNADTET